MATNDLFPVGTALSTFSQAPAQEAVAITPNDTAAVLFRAIYVGGGGDLVVRMIRDTGNVTLNGVLGGTFLPIAVKLVLSTGTTATNLVGLK